jgi:hypothetical protein
MGRVSTSHIVMMSRSDWAISLALAESTPLLSFLDL